MSAVGSHSRLQVNLMLILLFVTICLLSLLVWSRRQYRLEMGARSLLHTRQELSEVQGKIAATQSRVAELVAGSTDTWERLMRVRGRRKRADEWRIQVRDAETAASSDSNNPSPK